MRHQLLVLILGMFSWLLTHNTAILAQGQEVNIANPTHNEEEVVTRPAITLETNFPIDSSSITWNYGCPDSVACNWVAPTVLLLPSMIADSLDLSDTALGRLSIGGEYDLEDDTTLTFTPYANLAYGEEYRIVVKNLKVVVDTGTGSGPGDTIAVDEETSLYQGCNANSWSRGDKYSLRCKDEMRRHSTCKAE